MHKIVKVLLKRNSEWLRSRPWYSTNKEQVEVVIQRWLQALKRGEEKDG